MPTSPFTRCGSILAALLLVGCAGGIKDPAPELARLEKGEVSAALPLLKYCAAGGEKSTEVYQALIRGGEAIVPPLLDVLRGDDIELRAVAAGVVGNIGVKEATGPLIDAFRRSSAKRTVYLWALGQIRDASSIPLLVEVMTSGEPVLAKEATRSIIKIGKPAVASLTEALRTAPRGRRGQLFLALGDIGDKTAAPALLAADPGPEMEEYLRGIGRIGGSAAVPRCLDALVSPDGRIRLSAAQALFYLAEPGAVPALITARDGDPEVLVREWAARALETITGERQYYRNAKGEKVLPYNLWR